MLYACWHSHTTRNKARQGPKRHSGGVAAASGVGARRLPYSRQFSAPTRATRQSGHNVLYDNSGNSS